MGKKWRSAQTNPIEIGKDILIVLLLCSALFLLWEAQLLVGLPNPLAQSSDTPQNTTQSYQIQAEAARPVRMAAISGEGGAIYGIQYNNEAVDTLFQLSSNLLRETLGSLDAPVTISESQWRALLSSAPGLYFDMAGDVPLSVLSSWLSGQEDTSLTATPRRLLLTVLDTDIVALCYQTVEGEFYCCTTQVVDSSRLIAVIEPFSPNGAFFAFQSEDYTSVDPYTLLSASVAPQMVYASSNPISTEESRTQLLSVLGLDGYGNSVYPSTDGLGIVLRNDTDTLRIYGSGIVTYQGEKGHSLYPISSIHAEPSIFELVERCRSLASSALVPFCGDARLHLLSVQSENSYLIVNFSYTLNGSPIQFSDGSDAAQFIVEDGEIVEFTLRLRNYTSSDESSLPLPQRQAAAAMISLGHQGEELILGYYDSGASLVSSDWIASNR